MTSGERDGLLQSVATKIADYRLGEIAPVTEAHVDRWLVQFPVDAQLTILKEISRVVDKFYVSRATVDDFMEQFFNSSELFGENVSEGIRRFQFLDIQRNGKSQKDLLVVAETTLSRRDIKLAECGLDPSSYIYLDDGLFSGNTAFHDIEAWLPNCKVGATLHLVFIGVCQGGVRYLRNRLNPLLTPRRISLKIWKALDVQNDSWDTSTWDCFWPPDSGSDPQVDSYVQSVVERCEGKSFRPRLFRPVGTPREETLFSSSENRAIVERAFLSAGTFIVSLPEEPNLRMRPLGYEYLESLGFGAPLITYRNIANNCPLALWWGDPQAPSSHPLSQWYPLFPRRTNEPRVPVIRIGQPMTMPQQVVDESDLEDLPF
ncbi:MAG: hypothetical protein U0893_03510 [Chloroflexota bacterium]